MGTQKHHDHINSKFSLQNNKLTRTWAGQLMNQFPTG
jgi:hypothetical protein